MGVVYQIINKINGKQYIGSTVNWKRRAATHKCKLNNGEHPNRYLQNAWNKYGQESFVFVPIAICNNGHVKTEQEFIDKYKPE